MLIRFFL